MKRIYLIILFSFIVVTLRGAVLPEASQCFRNSAGLLVKGLWNGDADMLEEAAKGFDSVESGPLENPVIKENLSEEELESCFTLDYYMKNVDYIFERNGIKGE